MTFWRNPRAWHEDAKSKDLRELSKTQRGELSGRLEKLEGWSDYPHGHGRIRLSSLQSNERGWIIILFVKRRDTGQFGILHVAESPGQDPPPQAYDLATSRLREKPEW